MTHRITCVIHKKIHAADCSQIKLLDNRFIIINCTAIELSECIFLWVKSKIKDHAVNRGGKGGNRGAGKDQPYP